MKKEAESCYIINTLVIKTDRNLVRFFEKVNQMELLTQKKPDIVW